MIKIRQANIEDSNMYGEIHSNAWKQAYNNLFLSNYINQDSKEKRIASFINSMHNKNIQHFLCYYGDTAVGIIEITYSFQEALCEINNLYILHDFCGRGIGKSIMDFVFNMAIKQGMQKIILWTLEANSLARRFYEDRGFKLSGNTRIIERGKEYIQVQYYKNINEI